MILAQISDSHSFFPDIPQKAEVVVLCGDFYPDPPSDEKDKVKWQKTWVETRLGTIKEWLHGCDLLYCMGNHDYFPGLSKLLKKVDVDAQNITNRLVWYRGHRFYGFPYIPVTGANWNFEKDTKEMKLLVKEIPLTYNHKTHGINVLVAHAPPYGVLDTVDGKHLGNSALTNYLSYDADVLPDLILCGHIHEANGVGSILGVPISNGATGVRLIEL